MLLLRNLNSKEEILTSYLIHWKSNCPTEMRVRTTRKMTRRKTTFSAEGIDSLGGCRDETERNHSEDSMEILESINPSSIISLPSRYAMILMVGCCCIWSLTLASGFNQGFTSSNRLIDRRKSKEDSFSLFTLEAMPGQRTITGIRNTLSRTRRGYKSNSAMEEPLTTSKGKDAFGVITKGYVI